MLTDSWMLLPGYNDCRVLKQPSNNYTLANRWLLHSHTELKEQSERTWKLWYMGQEVFIEIWCLQLQQNYIEIHANIQKGCHSRYDSSLLLFKKDTALWKEHVFCLKACFFPIDICLKERIQSLILKLIFTHINY